MLVLSQAAADDAPILTRMIRDGKAHWGYPAEWMNAWKELGATHVRIEADPNAEGFYLHMGARRDGERISAVTGTRRVIPRLVYTITQQKLPS
jgi:hypothetical protein